MTRVFYLGGKKCLISAGYGLLMGYGRLPIGYLAGIEVVSGLCNTVFVIKKLHNYLLGAYHVALS